MYLLYGISLPNAEGIDTLSNILQFFGIMQVVMAFVLLCTVPLIMKRMILVHEEYGKSSMLVGMIFMLSNLVGGSFNLYLSYSGIAYW